MFLTPAGVPEQVFNMPQSLKHETLRPSEVNFQADYDDAATWAAEVLPGNMRTEFEFTFDGRELYGHDGRPLTPVFDDAINDAGKKAQQDPSLAFEVRRTKVERGELDDILAMARGEGSNTMVIESDFPEELMDSPVDVGGYNVQRKQTMLRVISRRPDGRIVMVSQSLEGSNRQGLEAIRKSLGYETQPGELLGQRMQVDLGPEEQEFFADQLTGVYDRELGRIRGGEWRAGWRVPTDRSNINTYDFVLQQDDLIQSFIKDSRRNPEGLYGFAAAMQKRYEAVLNRQDIAPVRKVIDFSGNPMMEMYQAAIEAKAEGAVFSGCGVSVGRDGQLTTDQELRELGFGHKSDEDKFGSLTFKCQKGHSNRRPHGKLIDNCQKCGISVRC